MTDKQLDEIYRSYNRLSETIPLPVERYTVDGRPTCCAWSGAGSKQRMACVFLCRSLVLGVHEDAQGSLMCTATGEAIFTYIEQKYKDFLRPDESCPLWEGYADKQEEIKDE